MIKDIIIGVLVLIVLVMRVFWAKSEAREEEKEELIDYLRKNSDQTNRS